MHPKLHEFLDRTVPVPYYRILRVLRKRYERKMERLTIEQLQRRDEALYREKVGHPIDWANPKAYTEKMQVEKLLRRDPIKARLTDKIAVRAWAAERIGEEYLVPLCGKGVYESAKELDFAALPNAFAVKTNAASGDAILVRDKSKLTKKDLRRIRARMDFRLHCCYAWYGYELHYRDIAPKLLTETYLGGTADVSDYKFLCFDGKPVCCWVDQNRFSKHTRNVYDLDWNLQPWNQRDYGNSAEPIEKPEAFDQMVALAAKLSEGFAHVRVDLYNIEGRICFGEMTFTNGAGFEPIVPYEKDLALGAYWNL